MSLIAALLSAAFLGLRVAASFSGENPHRLTDSNSLS